MSDEEADLDRQIRIEMKRAALARLQANSVPALPSPQQTPAKKASGLGMSLAKSILHGIDEVTKPGGTISKARAAAKERSTNG